MGILAENLTWLLKNAPPPAALLELGNQFLYIAAKPMPGYPDKYLNPTMAAPVAAKPYFRELGYEHVSIDINGKDGALPFDLAAPFELNRTFDMATDFGTSEHVACLWQCMENLHRHVRFNGLFLHVNPLTENWPGHGHWYRDETYYKAYAALTGYTLVETSRSAACANYTDGWNIWALLKKTTRSDFPTKDDFYRLPVKRH